MNSIRWRFALVGLKLALIGFSWLEGFYKAKRLNETNEKLPKSCSTNERSKCPPPLSQKKTTFTLVHGWTAELLVTKANYFVSRSKRFIYNFNSTDLQCLLYLTWLRRLQKYSQNLIFQKIRLNKNLVHATTKNLKKSKLNSLHSESSALTSCLSSSPS